MRQPQYVDHVKYPDLVDEFCNMRKANKVAITFAEQSAKYRAISHENERMTKRLTSKYT